MKFWHVKVWNKFYGREECFGVAWDTDDKERIKKIIQEVHTDYENVRVSRGKKPKDWTLYNYRE